MFAGAQIGAPRATMMRAKYVLNDPSGASSSEAPLATAVSAPGARKREVTCAKCNLRETCLSGGVPADDLARVENIVYARRRMKRGERLFGAGDEFRCLYAIRSGFFKTSIVDPEGREQVTGFFMSGELLGMDGLGSGRYRDHAIALEDSDVCVMPYALIEEMGREVPSLQRRLHSVLSREIVRDHGVMLLLGSMSAEERLAAFLLNLSRRFMRRGYSGSSFVLRMTREEIGSYLGLKLETVSRLFSAFHRDGLLKVQQKDVSIIDLEGLERLLAPGYSQHRRPRDC
jgi:CRP/FNR family transcriptional regulator, anaerobic regulatory protein